MKRFALGLVFSLVACNQAVSEPASPPPVSADRIDEAAASVAVTGTFASVDLLCAAQLKTARGCAEAPKDLEGTKLVLGGGILEVKAVAVDTELAVDTFLVTRTSQGWSTLKTPIFHDEHDDPGCPSMERATRIVSAIVDQGMLVVVNEANRYWYSEKEAGNLTLTYVRACKVGAACAPPAVVYAKADGEAIDNADAPPHVHLFSTSFTIASNGIISPAETYDDAKL